MYRGTTPDLALTIANVDFSAVEELWVSLGTENNAIVNKTLEDVTIDNQTIYIEFTQADTLALKARADVYVQVRILMNDGEALATPMKKLNVMAIIKDGVIV